MPHYLLAGGHVISIPRRRATDEGWQEPREGINRFGPGWSPAHCLVFTVFCNGYNVPEWFILFKLLTHNLSHHFWNLSLKQQNPTPNLPDHKRIPRLWLFAKHFTHISLSQTHWSDRQTLNTCVPYNSKALPFKMQDTYNSSKGRHWLWCWL